MFLMFQMSDYSNVRDSEINCYLQRSLMKLHNALFSYLIVIFYLSLMKLHNVLLMVIVTKDCYSIAAPYTSQFYQAQCIQEKVNNLIPELLNFIIRVLLKS
jgi:hypothetical protein